MLGVAKAEASRGPTCGKTQALLGRAPRRSRPATALKMPAADGAGGPLPACSVTGLLDARSGTVVADRSCLMSGCSGAYRVTEAVITQAGETAAPKRVVFGPLPKTSTGKIQKCVLPVRARAEGVGGR